MDNDFDFSKYNPTPVLIREQMQNLQGLDDILTYNTHEQIRKSFEFDKNMQFPRNQMVEEQKKT